MEIIFGIGIVGFLIGVCLGLYARHTVVVVIMLLLTIASIVGPMMVMAGEGLAGLAFAIVIPAVLPPILGYWGAFIFGSGKSEMEPARAEPQEEYTNIKSRHSGNG